MQKLSRYRAMSEPDMMSKLERARNSNNYRDADDVISGMRSKCVFIDSIFHELEDYENKLN